MEHPTPVGDRGGAGSVKHGERGAKMAILKSGDLSFDFRYTGFEAGWVQYQFFFCWKDDPVIKDSSLKRWNEYWNNRPASAFIANSYETDGFAPFLRKVLESDESDYWEPIEPDIIVALYVGHYFPFLKSHFTLRYECDDVKSKREARERLKKEQGKLPDDFYTFIVFVDAYNFKDADMYYGQGFSIQLLVQRQDLERFSDELEKEYAEFKQQFKVEEWNEDED